MQYLFYIYLTVGVLWGAFFIWAVIWPHGESLIDQTLYDLFGVALLFFLVGSSWPLWVICYYYELVVKERFGFNTTSPST